MATDRTLAHGFVLWLLALVLAALGAWMSLEAIVDRGWLARAGCLIVVLGVWSGVGVLVEAHLFRRTLELRRRVSAARLRRRYRHDEEERERRLAEMEERFAERLAARQAELELRFGLLEASLLITGTLIWGFGDLIRYLA